jgi:Uma2 family endonuclease
VDHAACAGSNGTNGMLVRTGQAPLHIPAAVPDGVFILNESVQTMRVQVVAGAGGGHVRIQGRPDLVLEVVSDASVQKDTMRLRTLNWKAGVREYWPVDARQDSPTFDILRRGARGFVAVR